MKNASNRNRNLKTSTALLKSQAHQSTSLFTSTTTNQRLFSRGWSREAYSPAFTDSFWFRIFSHYFSSKLSKISPHVAINVAKPTHQSRVNLDELAAWAELIF